MKILKNILTCVVIIAVILGVITIGINVLNKIEKEKVQKTIDTVFTGLKNYDLETVGKYMDVKNVVAETHKVIKTDTSAKEATEAEKAIFKYIEYKVELPEDLSIFDKEVVLDVKLSNKNMGEVLVKYFSNSLKFTFTNALSSSPLKEDKLNQKMEEIFVESIDSEDIRCTESTVTIKLVKVDNEWKLEFVDENQFINAILPSFQETLLNYLNSENSLLNAFNKN